VRSEGVRAWKQVSICRPSFYEIKKTCVNFGAKELAPKQRRHSRVPNETPPELEKQIPEVTARQQTYSDVRICGQLLLVSGGLRRRWCGASGSVTRSR